jgi:hypothetical protein
MPKDYGAIAAGSDVDRASSPDPFLLEQVRATWVYRVVSRRCPVCDGASPDSALECLYAHPTSLARPAEVEISQSAADRVRITPSTRPRR